MDQTGDEIANEVLLIRTKYKGPILLLEGSKDERFFHRLSMKDNLNLRFEGLRFDHFIDRNSLEIDQDKMLSNVFALTSNRYLDTKDISNRLSEFIDEMNDDPYQICCGHDFIEIFGIALRKILGSKPSKTAKPEVLGIALRLAYDSEDFYQTQLYAGARMWSKRNKGYDIFGPLAS